MASTVSSNRKPKVSPEDQAVDYVANTVFAKHAREFGEATKGLISQVGSITMEALEAITILVCMYWKQSEKGGKHKGFLSFPAPNGVPVRIARKQLPKFVGGDPDMSDLDAVASGQTIQRILQVFGCLYDTIGNNKDKILSGALEAFAAAEKKANGSLVSASGLLQAAKEEFGTTWASPLIKAEIAEDFMAEKAKEALTQILSATGRSREEVANFSVPKAFRGVYSFKSNDLEGLKATLDAAINRQRTIEATVTLAAAEKAFTYDQVESPALQAVNN